jgi:hypothetical protein
MFDLGIKIAQSRITHDRAARYKFALALENCVTGTVVGASKVHDASHTTLVDIVEAQENAGEALKNGSVLRVFTKAYFPFEETHGLEPGPLIRRPLTPSA